LPSHLWDGTQPALTGFNRNPTNWLKPPVFFCYPSTKVDGNEGGFAEIQAFKTQPTVIAVPFIERMCNAYRYLEISAVYLVVGHFRSILLRAAEN
jgi:hypothetical protein